MSRRKYTDEHIAFIKKTLPGRSYKEAHRLFEDRFNLGVTPGAFHGFCSRKGFCNGLEGQFRKGQEAWNKGMKGLDIGGKETRFKKGQPSLNKKPIGSERVDAKDGFTMVKVAEPNKWELKHRVIWEVLHGSIPDGLTVAFGDGDRSNFSPDNLILISRKQLAIMNKMGLKRINAEYTKSGMLIADLKLRVRDLTKAGK